MDVPKGYELKQHQTGRPVLWLEQREVDVAVPDSVFEALWGPGRARRLKSWGKDPITGVHWLASRAGTPMHMDPAYTRYCHHLTLRNDGYRLHGMHDQDEKDGPLFGPGAMFCLDTHSPHQVSPDPRLGSGIVKLALAVDTDDMLTPDQAWALMSTWIQREILV